MVRDRFTRGQISGARVEHKGGIDRVEQTAIEERLLVETVFTLFIELGEARFGIEIAKKRCSLFDRHFRTKPLSELLEEEQVYQERFIDYTVTDLRMADYQIHFPHLPALQLAPQPQEPMQPIQNRRRQHLNNLLLQVTRRIQMIDNDVAVRVNEIQIE